MQEERGRTSERTGHGYSRWTDAEKISVPGLPLFVPDVLSEPEFEALAIRYRIDEIGYKLAHNLLDIDLRARYVFSLGEGTQLRGGNGVGRKGNADWIRFSICGFA